MPLKNFEQETEAAQQYAAEVLRRNEDAICSLLAAKKIITYPAKSFLK